ncbi:MAG: MCE family protein [Myxococcales bacterium]|nr:MCE family protein [Myxococcales bacterium]
MDESRLELKVGALVVAAVSGVLLLLFFMGELSLGGEVTVKVDFAHTGSVVKNAPVKLGGVQVGHVTQVALLASRRDDRGRVMPVEMTLAISKEAAAALRADAAVTVSSQGPLGESYLELWPGSAPDGFDPKEPIRGTDAPRLDVVSNRLAHFLDAASDVLEKDPEALAKLFHGVAGLTTTVDGVLTENRDDLKTLTSELAATAKDLRALAATARTQLEPGGKTAVLIDDAAATAKLARTELPELSKKANTALTGVAAVAGQFTEEDGKRLKEMIAKYQAAGEKMDVIAARADRILARLEAGDGTLGALMKDKQVYTDLKDLLADLKAHPWKFLWKD